MPDYNVHDVTQKLEAGIKEVFEGSKYREFLSVMSRFHRYSVNNCILIHAQNPCATYVAGYNSWKKDFGRYVKKGEKGIKIIAPYISKEKVQEEKRVQEEADTDKEKPLSEEQKEEKKQIRFMEVTVFDISQTEGKELPELCSELTADVNNYDNMRKLLEEISPVPIQYCEMSGNIKGCFNRSGMIITIKNNMSESQTMKTLVHEIAHSILHSESDNSKSKNSKEVEAESVAFTVCNYMGIDTSDYSFEYIASWSRNKEMPELKESLNEIQKVSREIIKRIEDKIYPRKKTLQTTKPEELNNHKETSKILNKKKQKRR